MIKPQKTALRWVTILVVMSPAFLAAQSSDVPGEISREWQELNSVLNLNGVMLARRKGSGSQSVTKVDEGLQTKLLQDNCLLIHTNFLDDLRYVIGVNDSYAFRLSAKQESQFVIEDINELSDFDDGSFMTFRYLRVRRQRHPSLEFFMIMSWPTIMASEGIAVSASRDIEWNGKSALEVNLNCEPTKKEFDPRINTDQSKLVPRIHNCRVVFLKDFNFLPAEWECDMKLFPDADFTPINVVLDYDFTSFDVPFPIKRTLKRVYKGENDVETTDYSYDFTRPDNSEFYVSAFGLPEPPFVRRKGLPYVVWFVIGGLILFAVGMFILRKRRG